MPKLTPEQQASYERQKAAADYGSVEVPPGRFDLTEEDYADLPVLDIRDVLDPEGCGDGCVPKGLKLEDPK